MTLKKQAIQAKLANMQEAYRYLYIGSLSVLEPDSAYWTKRWLFKLVNGLAQKRLEQINTVRCFTDRDRS